MSRADGQVIGIRLRSPDGRKLSARGGRDGVFLPCVQDTGLMLVTEGESDAAAALALGFDVVGRPSCTGGTKDIVRLCRGRHVVIVADRDEPGRRGAEALASVAVLNCPTVRIIEPPEPHKDLRAWMVAGAKREDVQAVIDHARVRELSVVRGRP